MNEQAAIRNNIDLERCKQNAELIKQNPDVIIHILDAVNNISFDGDDGDVDFKIYSGFFSYKDKNTFKKIKSAPIEEKFKILNKTSFEDDRAKTLIYRYICRNFEKDLTGINKDKWIGFCKNRITNPPEQIENNLESFKNELKKCSNDSSLDQKQIDTLKLLENYMNNLFNKLDNKEL
jgi:exodeoxyribonuclease-1